MNKNQKGFALIEALLILIVVGILAGTGWYVWDSRNKTGQSLDGAVKTSASTQEPAKVIAKPTASWPTYKDTVNDIAFSYPPDWKVSAANYTLVRKFVSFYITSPDIKEESREPFGPGTNVAGGSRITLVFYAQSGKTLDEIFSSSIVTNSTQPPKETRQINDTPAYEYEYGYDSPVARHIIFIKGSQYSVAGHLESLDISKTGPSYDTFIKVLESIAIN